MGKLRVIFIVGLLAAGLAALPVLLPGTAVQAAGSGDGVAALSQQAHNAGGGLDAAEDFDKALTENAGAYIEAYNHDKRRVDDDEDDDEDDDDY